MDDDHENPGASYVEQPSPDPADLALPVPEPDGRLYLPDHEEWDVKIKRDSERVYCYAKFPGEDWFHMILNGEIYLTHHHERYCLECALRLQFVTLDRLFWQHRVPKKKTRIL